MRIMLILLSASFSGFVLGQTEMSNGWVKDISNVSAVTALILSLGFLLKVYIPARDAAATKQQEASAIASAEQQKAFTTTLDKMADRHDAWEQLRHTDHETLQETLRCMTAECAQSRAAMLAAVEPKPNWPGG